MASLNKVTLIGNVGKDPEIRSLSENKEVASFPLATSEYWKDKTTGERKEKTEWHKISVFNEGLVRLIKLYVSKGSKLYIEGSLQTRKWIDSNGVEKYSTEVILQGFSCVLNILNMESKDKSEVENISVNNDIDLDDEIPF